MTVRIAMWSGPRNISTAIMRAWENRPDCAVSDEPFYAAYLAATGLDHPLRDEVLAAQPTDWREVAAALCGGGPGGEGPGGEGPNGEGPGGGSEPAPIWYQKHMCQHMLPDVGLDWARGCRNVFLLRAPEQVLASYALKRANATLDDIGFRRQAELFDHLAQITGAPPVVIEAADVLGDPRATLSRLCAAVDVPFSEHMLAWPAGRRQSDGVWAPAWYEAVERSTGFTVTDRPATRVALPDHLARVADAARPYYERLLPYRL